MKTPTLILIDFQEEYQTPGRDFYIQGIEESLQKSSEILSSARKNAWNIIHVKHYRENAHGDELFSKESHFSDYINEFRPKANEKEVIKNLYSSFSAPEFEQELKKQPDSPIFIIGYNTAMCVLSTIIEGYHRGYKMTLLKDASSAKSDGITSEKERHQILTSVLSSFGKIETVDETIAHYSY